MKYLNIQKFKFSSNKHVYLTKEGIDSLKKRLDTLSKERFDICNRLRQMDPKEKAEYILSADEIKMLEVQENEVEKISEVLQNARLLPKHLHKDDVRLGSTVNLRLGGDILEYTLVDSIEADPSAKKISNESPLGRALIGHKAHEMVQVVSPRGRQYK